MNEPIRLPGDSLFDQAVHLAGVLAEHGATKITAVSSAGVATQYAARSTDLPGLIVSGGLSELICDELGVRLTMGSRIEGTCGRADVAASLAGSVGKNLRR